MSRRHVTRYDHVPITLPVPERIAASFAKKSLPVVSASSVAWGVQLVDGQDAEAAATRLMHSSCLRLPMDDDASLFFNRIYDSILHILNCVLF